MRLRSALVLSAVQMLAACARNDSTPANRLDAVLQTASGNYLSADNGGGGAITAIAPWAHAWEHFTLFHNHSGDVKDGDEVFFAALNGSFLSAVDGGGGAVTATAPWMRDWESFTLVRADGPGVVHSGDHVALRTKLTQTYLSAINGGGGEVLANAPAAHSAETFGITLGPAAPFGPRQEMLGFLVSVSGQKTLAGVHNREPNSDPSHFSDTAFNLTGKHPALWSGDFLFEPENISARPTMIAEAIRQWNKGAVIDLIYSACPPTRDEACGYDGGVVSQLSDEQWFELIAARTTLNNVWKSRLDRIAVYLQQLKDNGVAVLFRPQHEMNQSAFWWGGRAGPSGTAKLYQITHDYLAHDKGLDNIVWVWSLQDLSGDYQQYNPGSDYFDIVALDVFGGDGFTTDKYNALLAVAAGKPIAIGACARLPNLNELSAQPKWTYFIGFAELMFASNSAQELTSLYSAQNVLTREGMPGWKP